MVSPFKMLELQEARTRRAKPREFIDVWMIPKRDYRELAALRVHHPGGAPNIDPATWTGAYENGRIVAAIGWTMFEEGIITIQEIDRIDGRWGTIGSTVLIRSFLAGAAEKGMRVQAWVMPGNAKLKEFITRNVPNARVILEIWEAVHD